MMPTSRRRRICAVDVLSLRERGCRVTCHPKARSARVGEGNERAQVVGTTWNPIPGLYACGGMVGGLFHTNYPGGTGLMSGAVFGRIAGAHAAGD